MYLINYECPNCNHSWQEIYSCACDSECGECNTDHIEALTFEQIGEKDET